MFISKDDWKAMCIKVNNQQREINDLISCHMTNFAPHLDSTNCIDGYARSCMIKNGYKHESIKVDTQTIQDITLEELARYVIDNEPIIREETIKVKTEYRQGE